MIWQLLIIGISTGALYALVAFALGLTYGTRKFFDFSLAAVFTASAYSVFGAMRLGMPSAFAITVGLSVGVILTVVFDQCVFLRLRKRSSGDLEAFLASLGLLVATEAVVAMFCGRETQLLARGMLATREFLDVRVTDGQLTIVGTTMVLLAIWKFVGHMTSNVLYARAIADDEELAIARGVSGWSVRLFTVIAAGVSVASAGILYGLDLGITPTMGLDVLLVAMVAMIVGKTRGIFSIVLVAFTLGIVQQVVLFEFSARWQSAVIFSILFVFVLFDRSTKRSPLHDGEM